MTQIPTAIIFDLDGVLVDTPDIHYHALNRALEENGKAPIDRETHLRTFNGLSTRQKLRMLHPDDADLCHTVWEGKQRHTVAMMEAELQVDNRLQSLLQSLTRAGIRLGCATNCIRKTQQLILSRLGIAHLFDVLVSNDDVERPKPDPHMYQLCMQRLGVTPADTTIVEDSPLGIASARASGAHVVVVTQPSEVTFSLLLPAIELPQVVVPMAGHGSRFAVAGYKDRKPFIPVQGAPMIRRVVDNLGLPEASLTLVCLADDRAATASLFPDSQVIVVDKVTEGAACTAMLAVDTLDPTRGLLIANSDQLADWDVRAFLIDMARRGADGGILCFRATDPKWSFAELDQTTGWVARVAEKDPISDIATVGIYWWKRADLLAQSTAAMIQANDRTRGEFYLCPTFNHAIRGQGAKIAVHFCRAMHGLGTPSDLEAYLARHRPKFIAHRGNTQGPRPDQENRPAYIQKAHAELGCDVEVDVWLVDGGLWLGHDKPQYAVDEAFLRQPFLWRHAKNMAALQFLTARGLHCFWHQEDAYTITSRRFVWCYPGSTLGTGSVAVMPERADYTQTDMEAASFVCSDYASPSQWVTKKNS